jgi:dephospho-CoA kinase
VKKVLITGMSGTGKSTALAELESRGFRVVDTDEPGWKVLYGDEWVWDEERMSELLDEDHGTTLYVSGCVANQGRFYDRFDAIVLLSAPAEVMLERIANRTTNPFGKKDTEREQILADRAKVEPLLRKGATHELDATKPAAWMVEELIAIANNP